MLKTLFNLVKRRYMSFNAIKEGDKTQAFEGMAASYDQARPSYPLELYAAILLYWQEEINLKSLQPVIVDAGCGTGISTRRFYQALEGKCTMVGIEPGTDMLATAQKVSPNAILYKKGSAEAIPLDAEFADIVTAAQAAQWFKRPLFYQEVQRILKPHGVIAIYENNRDWERSKFLDKHEEFLEECSVDRETNKRYSRYYRDFPYQSELAETFRDARTLTFFWERKMRAESFLEMAKTSTQVKRAIDAIGEAEVNTRIMDNANNHLDANKELSVQYNTRLYIARK